MFPHPPPPGLFSPQTHTVAVSPGLHGAPRGSLWPLSRVPSESSTCVLTYSSTHVRLFNHSRSKTSTNSLNSRSSSSRAIFTFWWVSLRT